MYVLFFPRSLRFAKELEKLVGDVMRYILFNIGKQNSQPIAREKVTALVTKKYPRKTGLSQTVLQKARHRFAHIWGMDLRELVKTTAAGEGSERGEKVAEASPATRTAWSTARKTVSPAQTDPPLLPDASPFVYFQRRGDHAEV